MRYSVQYGMCLIALFTSTAEARIVRQWTFRELTREADVVIVVTSKHTIKTKFTDKHFDPKNYVQIETTLKVDLLLKGRIVGDTIKFVHFRGRKITEELQFTPANAENFVDFQDVDKTKNKTKIAGPEYLVFLKRRSDGRYEAVSGQSDPIDSVWKLTLHDSAWKLTRPPRSPYFYTPKPKFPILIPVLPPLGM